MGFRNPITTAIDPTARDLANQALTGIIPGSRLAADAINGKTITGATVTGGTVQTATSGPRLSLSSGSASWLLAYSGDLIERYPGGVTVGLNKAGTSRSTTDNAYVLLQPPTIAADFVTAAGAQPTLAMQGTSRDGTQPGYLTLYAGGPPGATSTTRLQVQAGQVVVGNPGAPDVPLSDSGQLDLTPAAGWTAGSDGMHYRVLNGVCHFQLLATRASSSTPATVCTFPVRPKANTSFTSIYANVQAELKVFTSGVAQISGTGNVAVAGSFPLTY